MLFIGFWKIPKNALFDLRTWNFVYNPFSISSSSVATGIWIGRKKTTNFYAIKYNTKLKFDIPKVYTPGLLKATGGGGGSSRVKN